MNSEPEVEVPMDTGSQEEDDIDIDIDMFEEEVDASTTETEETETDSAAEIEEEDNFYPRRSEALPFLRVNRPKRHQKEVSVDNDMFSTIHPTSFTTFSKICESIKDSFAVLDDNSDANDILDYDSLNLFITYGFRSLTSLSFTINGYDINRLDQMNFDSEDNDSEDEKESDPGQDEEGIRSIVKACSTCGRKSCNCPKLAQIFLRTSRIIQANKNWRKVVAEAGLYIIIKEQTRARVHEECLGKYYTRHISELLTWLDSLSPWIEIVSSTGKNGEIDLQAELKLFLLEIIGNAIISELFPIIIEFPDSRPVLEDLKYCLRKVSLRKHLVSSLKSTLDKRLLNPGVNTTDLLDAYVSAVRALKFVDPSGILVQLVTPPIREYLKRREETVRVILVSLTEETGELAEELARNPSHFNKDMAYWDEWNPDPIDVPKDQHNLRKSDLIQTILSIYGSKSLFMDEYRALLADRLLKMSKPRPITHEIKCLELLKLRFGESDLQKCEVMLKDVTDSHRLNTRFREEEGAVLAHQEASVTGLIISAQFWPTLKQESLILPKHVETSLAIYTKAFEMIKGNRSLEWQRHIGYVQLELDINNVQLSFSVSPLLATLIWHFQEKEKWNLDDLSVATGLPTNLIKIRMGFWVSKGIIAESGEDSYQVNEAFLTDGSQATSVNALRCMEEEEIDSPMTSTSAQREAELQVFWSYIEGMLTNLESLPLSRIYSMLKLFATVECSLEDVQKFLDQKVGLGVLLYSNGNYKVPKM